MDCINCVGAVGCTKCVSGIIDTCKIMFFAGNDNMGRTRTSDTENDDIECEELINKEIEQYKSSGNQLKLVARDRSQCTKINTVVWIEKCRMCGTQDNIRIRERHDETKIVLCDKCIEETCCPGCMRYGPCEDCYVLDISTQKKT